MYVQVKKPKESMTRSVAGSVSQKKIKGQQGFSFVDNRAETFMQRKLQALANMAAQVEDPEENKCRVVANSVAQRKNVTEGKGPTSTNRLTSRHVKKQSPNYYHNSLSFNRSPIQRAIHLFGNPLGYKFFPDNDSHAFYHIADNAGGTVLSSEGYASCVGLSIFRPAQAAAPDVAAVPSRGMLVHFWASGKKTSLLRVTDFQNDVEAVLEEWGEMGENDQITYWSGASPAHRMSTERMAVFADLLPIGATRRAHPSGNAYLDLDTGEVTA